MFTRSFTDDELRIAVSQSVSFADTLRKLNLKVTGGSYGTVYRLIGVLKIDTSHIIGNKRNKGKSRSAIFNSPIQSVYSLLKENSTCCNNKLKQRLIKEGIFKNECSLCHISSWQGKELVLHMDHINGTPSDNRLENLRLLCPNCHSQTTTYCGRNAKKTKALVRKKATEQKFCLRCKKKISRKATQCKSCAAYFTQGRKISWPPTKDLLDMLKTSNYTQVGKKLGVSDNAIRKHIRNELKKVGLVGLEPTRDCSHQGLNLRCLPISP